MKKMLLWLRRVALLSAIGWAVSVFGWIPYWLGGIATSRRFNYPDRENGGLTPVSYGLGFEQVQFNALDGVRLDGWWVPSTRPKGTVVLVHGLNRSRIEMVRKLPFLHSEEWNALLFDLRRHGTSGGERSGFGHFEKTDVRAAVEFSRSRDDGPIVIWGISLGAASAILAASEDPTISGLVCDSSYRSLRDTVHHHLDLFRRHRWWLWIAPTWPVADEVVYWIGRRGGFDPDSLDIVAAAGRLAERPVLFVCNAGDRRMPPEIAFELQAAAGRASRVLVVPGTSHGGAYREGTSVYETSVLRLLRSVSQSAPAADVARSERNREDTAP